MTKYYIIALAILISATTVFYFNVDNHSGSSDYELLVLADHEKLTSGQFSIQMNSVGAIESPSFNITRNSSSTAKSRNRMLAPAINAVAVAKFLNGNLPSTTPAGNNGIPLFLSQTGAFSNLNELTPSLGLIPYDMIEPFWSDGATKKRWMVIPNDGTHDTPEEQITLNNEAWGFPRGAVLIKHFELGGKRLETRFEVKGDDDEYYYLTYKWNNAQTDASLLNDSVDEDIVVNGVTQSWHYPSRTECASCHFPQNGSILGPKTRNLNKTILYPSSGVQMNQLVNLSELGILNEAITTGTVNSYPAIAAKDDLSASIENRARSYIDINCASCHNPEVSNVAMFDARYTTPIENQNIIYGDVIYDEGLNNPKVIIPQDVPNSMAHFRMNSTQTGIEMPPLAKDVADQAGVELIADWINSLTPSTSQSPTAAFSASTTYGVAPLSVNFDATSSFDTDGDILSYSWSFGDGTAEQGIIVDHVYLNSGSYTATLIVSDGQRADQETTIIIVNNSNPGSNTVSFSDATNLINQDNFSGLPMGVIDMNGDGKDDIVQFNSAKNLRIQYQNETSQSFTTYSYGQVSTKNQWGTAIADFDQNGFNDILSGGAYDNLKIITNNNGNNSFNLATLPNSNIFLQGSNFADINNDGWIDIFACHDDAESRAYSNNQDGTFSFDANLISTETDPTSDNSGNYASMWIDYDNDRDLDLYISKCRGGVTDSNDPRRINMLWQNDGSNNFTEVAAQANLKIGNQTWLTDFGDIDNDGDLDALIINHGTGPNLMRNDGNGTFTEVTSGSGLLPILQPQDFYGIQGFFRDFNNDGYLDLMVSGDNHYIFYNNGDGTFQNAPNPFNSNQIQSFSVGDLNHDGALDLYAGYANGLNSPSSTKDRIWLNEGNSNNFLNIQLKGTQSNINGIGARVEVYGTWGMQIRDVRSGEGYGLVNSYTQHFGIGVNTEVDKVVVRWPSGIVDEIPNPSINQFLTIVENEELRENIALNKTSQQSSTNYGGNSYRAVDGNTDGEYAQESTTHTNQEVNAWWRVDLENTYELSTIKVFNRSDCCAERLDLAKVYVGNIDSNNPSDYSEIGVLNANSQQNINDLEIVGRYIMIYQEQNQPLSIAEVQAFGELVATNVTGINVNPELITIDQGITQRITATVQPANASDTSVIWSSSDTNIATVDTNGLVIAVALGNATITATTNDGDFNAQSSITVLLPVNGVTVNPESATISDVATQQLTAMVFPSDATDSSVSWNSNDEEIATVDTNGLVTGVSEGTATITATTDDGDFIAESIINITSSVPLACAEHIIMEFYANVPGVSIIELENNPNFPGSPSSTSELAEMLIPYNSADNYGVRVKGLLKAPETGTYYFWITGDNHVELNLSDSDNSTNKSRIAYHEAWSQWNQWNKYPTQKSVSINLIAGQNYYIEALMNESTGSDYLAVGWRRPSDGNGTEPAQLIPCNVFDTFAIPSFINVTGVTITPSFISLETSETNSLTANVSPSNASNPSVNWSSSDSSIAVVEPNGTVTGISPGTVTISAQTVEGGFVSESTIEITDSNANACSNRLVMETYENVPGFSIAQLKNNVNFPNSPSSTSFLDSFIIPYDINDNYGVRVKGLLKAPETGTYYFWITGDDNVELNLSSNTSSSTMSRIAYHNRWSGWNQWNKYPTQKSVGIDLVAGQNYYIEALMNELTGADYLSVGWRRPSDGNGAEPAQLIPCDVFDTFIQSQSLLVALSQLQQENALDFFLSPNPASDQVWISLIGFDQVAEMTYFIYDNSGKMVMKGRGGIEEIINISGMTPGIYVVIVKSGNWSGRKKLIVR